MDLLREELCRLAAHLEPKSIRVLLAGGYGLLLKAAQLREAEAETVAPIPFARATDDLDVILTADLIVNAASMIAVRDALLELGYEPMEGRQFYQWTREIDLAPGVRPTVKIDLPGQIPEDRSTVRLKERRMRPRDAEGLHANPLEEAAFVDRMPTAVPVCGSKDGPSVDLPHPFNYMLLKLFTFEDRKDDDRTDFGRHHAFDLYRIVGMLTRDEWDQVISLREELDASEVVSKAKSIAGESFSGLDSKGGLRLREHVRAGGVDVEQYPVAQFLVDLAELLGLKASED